MINRRSFLGTASLAAVAAGTGLFEGCCSCGGAAKAAAKKVPFKLAMAGYSCVRLNLKQTLELLKRLDVHYLCIKDFHLPFNSNAQQIADFHKLCQDYGVTGYGVGPIYMQKPDCRKYMDYAKAVGVKTLVAVPNEDGVVNGKKTKVASRACCEELSKLCKEYDIRVAIHNHGPDIPHCFPTGDAAFEMVKDLDPRMGLCLDIGHNFRAGLNPVESIKKLHTRMFDMHIKNVKFDNKRNIAVPMPKGDMDMPAIVKALCDVNYTGCCSLEYERFPGKPKDGKPAPGVYEDEIAESIGYFQGLMKAVEA